jgi:hypothetical protein
VILLKDTVNNRTRFCDVACNLWVQDIMFVGMADGGDPEGSNCVEVMSNFNNMYCWCYAEMVWILLNCDLHSSCVKTIFWLAGRPSAVKEDPIAWSHDVRAVLVVCTWDVNLIDNTVRPYDETNHLVLFREIITVCSDINIQPINMLCRQNLEFANVKPGGKESYHSSKGVNNLVW